MSGELLKSGAVTLGNLNLAKLSPFMSGEDEIPVWCAGKEWCAITATAKIIGKKWHPVILDRLIQNQPLGFNALKREVDGISSKVLSESLEDLRQKKLAEKEVTGRDPKRVEYAVTEKAEELSPVLQKMREWGNKHLSEPEGNSELSKGP